MTRGTTRRRTSAELESIRRERDLRRAVGLELRNQRADAGVTQTALARAAQLSQAQVSRIEAGLESPSLGALAALSVAMGVRLSVRFEPITGPPIRDHIQARMIESLLHILDPRWKRFIEVPVHRPVRGVIDLVLHDVDAGVVVAVEAQSQIRRLEQQLRWANAKADALIHGSELPLVGPGGEAPAVSRVLLLRNTAATRDLARAFPSTFEAGYPAKVAAAFASLTTASPWPGSAIVWVTVEGRDAQVLPQPPRSVALGR
jgi:transcriptional regulator with XRE-family HTH domain